MKPVVFVALLILSSGALVWTPAQAIPPGCTEIGTQERDIIAGTAGPDKVCLLGDRDYSHSAAGNDVILGGADSDTLVGGPGRDRILGGPGDDRLFSIDSRGNDVVKGGAGFDRCYLDTRDVVRSCEERRRVGTTPDVAKTIAALSSAILGAVTLGEEEQEEVDRLLTVIVELQRAACPPPSLDASPPPCP